MSSLSRPRGKLPARVYWFRRGLVLVTALALVFAVGRLLGDGADGADRPGTQTAAPAAAQPTDKAAGSDVREMIGPVQVTAKPKGKKKPRKGTAEPKASATGTPLAQPSGRCELDEITVRADITSAAAGGDVTIPLELTGTQAACRFRVAPSSLVVKITSGSDRIWSSQQCRRAIPTKEVVVRSAQPTRVEITWDGRRSDDECPKQTQWALPGYYHAITSVIGSEPSDAQFRLTAPPRAVVTETAEPKPKKG